MRLFTAITTILASAKACQDIDFSTTDAGGDNCASWYNEFPDTCGKYDDEDFLAELVCCACGGGLDCVDTSFDATDSHGHDCDWYNKNPQACDEDKNDDDFLR